MDLLDLIIILICIGFAVSGYRQGFVVGVMSFFGFVGGLLVGVWLVPEIMSRFQSSLVVSTISLCAVLALAVLGQVLATTIGSRVRRELTWRPVQAMVSVLLVTWFLGLALATSAMPVVVAQVHESRILAGIQRILPADSASWFRSFSSVLGRSGFPQVFGPFTQETIANVPAPDPAVLSERGVVSAESSIVKIVGDAPSCGKQIEGSGFVFAPHHVMTNAHVVGGVSDPTVQIGGVGQYYRAKVVLYDPETDISVLDVPDLNAPALHFDTSGKAEDDGVVAGFPEDGPFRAVAARIRQEMDAQGQDIYDQNTVTRDIYSLYSTVLQGNSGGPLLSPDGEVYGVVFAKSLQDASTGYALTADQVEQDAQRGANLTAAVDTEGCAV